jgi:uncharacterized membrane protein YgdD (TMEM256/DUF423 family)
MIRAFRVVIAAAGLMGAAGVVLAAGAAHAGDAALLLPASTMLLFHACAVLGTVALAERGIVHTRIGLIATLGFVVAAALFSGDLVMRQYAHGRLFPFAAPTGGTLLILSWLTLSVGALCSRRA